MPTIFYGDLTARANMEKLKAGDESGLVQVLCTITEAKRERFSAAKRMDLYEGRIMCQRAAPQHEVEDPLTLFFKVEGEPNGSGTTLTDALQIRALLSEYGVEKPEELVGKPVLVYKRNVAKPGQEPLGAGTIAFSRPE